MSPTPDNAGLRGRVLPALLALLCLALALGLRDWLLARMSLHMLVQIPLLVFAGVFAALVWAPPGGAVRTVGVSGEERAAPAWSWNEYGLPGLLLVSLAGACWMIPKALDDALTDWRVAAFKYLGLPLCGWILRFSVPRANVVIKVFILGNFCWMSAIVGMIYLDNPVRLCNAYLQDDQQWSGVGLIALALVLPVAWLSLRWKSIRHYLFD